ncbi:RecQ family ATP-dependent DNA helicase [Dactylosporangium fulvum]|uniref:ATP-dependent DNA helicase RecQ n=1 Tax=Dactylosporangium fulvum TaxID=53359 RepID=A0ABY5W4Y0_9ACTN|nr:ATP-dependent DNA helicase RecQ [Dactylosporangium fulvum]UWP84597.1 ATP-dependent DNA helicase [Dactylosporangium fulvum]
MTVTDDLRRVARERFGWQQLRDVQLRAMEALMAGRDALAVLPTGAGKSAIYQVPAPLLPGPTIVISPLLALQQDQIASLSARHHESLVAVRLSSAEGKNERAEALEALRAGDAEFVFLTPEQFADPARAAQIKALKPSLVAVDEAHCVSAWGHDFRPDYLQLGQFIRELGRPPVVALTATASPPVREDIVERLGMRDPEVVVGGLDRSNLFLESVHCPDEETRWRRLVARLRESAPPGIIYAPTRRSTEELTERLQQEGFEAVAYHGGMSAGERERAHEAFLADEVPIMVATTAFGMGIDKPNIRWVNHVSLPDSPDSYLQEIGRAGRDGKPAHVLLLHRTEDSGLRKFFTNVSVDRDEVSDLAALLRAADKPLTRDQLEEKSGLGARKLGQLLTLLEEVGGARMLNGGKVKAPRWAPVPARAAELAEAQAERQQTVSRSRLDMMRSFAETELCRGQALLAYFGEHLPATCGHCDNCQDGSAAAGVAATGDVPFPIHSEVRHGEWGKGVVLSYAGEQMTVLFEKVGYKTLSVPVVQEHKLLRQIS